MNRSRFGALEAQGIHALTSFGSIRQGPSRNVAVGALIISPASVRDKMNQVNAHVSALDADIRSNVTRPGFLETWNTFKSNWQKFYEDHQSTASILLTGTGTLDRKADQYQAELPGWYAALKNENPSARTVFPPPTPPSAPPGGAEVPWWGITLLSIAGTGILAYLTYATYLYVQRARQTTDIIQGAAKRYVGIDGEEIDPRVILASRRFSSPMPPRRIVKPSSMTRLHAAPVSNDPAYGGTSPVDETNDEPWDLDEGESDRYVSETTTMKDWL